MSKKLMSIKNISIHKDRIAILTEDNRSYKFEVNGVTPSDHPSCRDAFRLAFTSTNDPQTVVDLVSQEGFEVKYLGVN